VGLRRWIEKERTPVDWAWIVFGWVIFIALTIAVIVIVVKAINFWNSI
jgi:hypothetical protein